MSRKRRSQLIVAIMSSLVCRVFKALKRENLRIQMEKSRLLREEVEFLGHVVCKRGESKKDRCSLQLSYPKNPETD